MEVELSQVSEHLIVVILHYAYSDCIQNLTVEVFLLLDDLFLVKDGRGEEPLVVVVASEEFHWLPNLLSVDLMLEELLSSEDALFNLSQALFLSVWLLVLLKEWHLETQSLVPRFHLLRRLLVARWHLNDKQVHLANGHDPDLSVVPWILGLEIKQWNPLPVLEVKNGDQA